MAKLVVFAGWLLLATAWLSGCGTLVLEDEKPIEPKEEAKLGKKLSLWSTYYYAPEYSSIKNGVPLRSKDGKSLGVELALEDICNYMLQGSGFIDGKIYGWGGVNDINKIDCSRYYSPRMVSGRLKFKRDTHIRGVKNYKITAFKTIAVDQNTIPYGSKVFIPSFKGVKYLDDDGSYKTHDGVVYALDTGGAIKGNQIDFYVGKARGGISSAAVKVKPFVTVKSTPKGVFDAYIIK